MKACFILALTVFASACATMTHRGVIAMKVSEHEAHVGIGKNELSVGDHVELYRNVCKSASGRRGEVATGSCEKKIVGHGVVTGIINDDYSSVKFDDGVSFIEGDMIEKHEH